MQRHRGIKIGMSGMSREIKFGIGISVNDVMGKPLAKEYVGESLL